MFCRFQEYCSTNLIFSNQNRITKNGQIQLKQSPGASYLGVKSKVVWYFLLCRFEYTYTIYYSTVLPLLPRLFSLAMQLDYQKQIQLVCLLKTNFYNKAWPKSSFRIPSLPI